MPLRDPAVYLEDIEHHAEAALRFMDGCSLEQYLADDKTRAAVERVLEICGEALKQLLQVDGELGQQIPHARDIIGFRNILAHGYAVIDHALVYGVVRDHVPALLVAVRQLLAAFPTPEEEPPA